MDIGKTIPKVGINIATPDTVTNTTEEKTTSKNIVTKIIELYKNNEDISKFKIDVKKLNLSPEFNKLSENEKNSILKILSDEVDDLQAAYRICRNCTYHLKLTETTLILSRMNLNSVATNNDSYKFIIHDKTLPHTRDYNCKNDSCESHKDPAKKNAVWFRPKLNSYATYYGCLTCETIWNIS